jgi:chromosome partition protein MukB
MKRVRARTLVLVNWKGVFYERYLLDEHVSAMEGDNGAGKTTVMIAAYVVMLPDMTRLRFTNVGESDATGGDKGIWGRLGNPNRPSYSVLEFDLGGERLVAGVQLERKGEPSVELTPFIISDLPFDVRHQDVLLLRSEEEDLVPEIQDLRENVTRLGGRIQVFRTAKEYFAALFDRGVTPLRLAVEDERTRFNDMLRTSMTGGISRALTSEFRSFLLKEEGGLADTLVRMRSNLDACRRTRTEVTEARELEGEISGVYEAGHEMFSAALLAARERAAELQKRVDEARATRDGAKRQRDGMTRELEQRAAERRAAEERKRRTEEEMEGARELHARIRSAHGIAERLAGLERELDESAPLLREAAVRNEEARTRKERRAEERTRAEDGYTRAARGLAEIQRGLEELHRRADAHRTVTRRLQEAGEILGEPGLRGEEVDAWERETDELMRDLDLRRKELDAAISLTEARREEHASALEALTGILGREVDAGVAHEEARATLQHLAELDILAGRADELEEELQETRAAWECQERTRATSEALSEPGEPLRTSSEVRAALARNEEKVRALERQARAESSDAEECLRRQKALQQREQELQLRHARWRELDSVASRLDDALGTTRRTVAALESARQVLDDERDAARRRLDAFNTNRDELLERARSLEQTGGLFHDDLIAARDLVGGELLAGHFDDVDPAEAGRLQARLGPLADAIVVQDGRDAARMLGGHRRELDTIWFVEGGSLHEVVGGGGDGASVPAATEEAEVVVVNIGVVRSTRVPFRPTLGREARRRLIAELRAETDGFGTEVEGVEDELAEIAARRRDVALLMRGSTTLEAGDPAPALDIVRADLTEWATRLDGHRRAAEEVEGRAAERRNREDALRDLLADAYLLDQADLGERVSSLESRVGDARRAGRDLSRVEATRRVLAEGVDALRHAPPTNAELDAMRAELVEANDRRGGLYLALDALRYVASNREALAWSDAEAALAARAELVPALKRQCEQADQTRREAKDAAEKADGEWEEARRAWRELDDRRNAVEAYRERTEGELAECGVEDPSAAALERAGKEVSRLTRLVAELDREERGLGDAVARIEERLTRAEEDLAAAEDLVVREEREWRPAADRWERLRSGCEERGLITPAITTRLLNTGAGSVNLRSEAQAARRALEERLTTARGGNEILAGREGWFSGQDQTTGDDYVGLWEMVRDWIRRRVPAQIAEVDDPVEALERLRRHLQALGERLDGQEALLRGASEDVARGIDVHLRSAQRQVKVLNRELAGVRFGTIAGIRIRLSRDDRMEAVLTALRRGSAQELLFVPSMPIEEALDELFTRYGGRGETLGRRLLDYREYVEIVVEIQRTTSAEWEAVNPSRLSTGEAIGVGTALMMVVLTAWERSANLFREKRSLGTLRLLFLDEANRLSQDNLDILFELCAVLDLQLMIASPEVARGPGCTTYRLVRRTTADGREEVLVSGRRTVATDGPDVGA